ncbi:MAG: long-chain-fatty-acid--CoA ligase [Thermodesulfobacteriota bacterium]|nr:long-chain-fatty-acid--CoA ligase [Thermodesulfobacteriota bacterium]
MGKWKPLLMETWRDVLELNASIYETDIAYVDVKSGNKYSYKDLHERSNRFVNALNDMGVKKGDRAAILSMDRPQYLEASSITKAGIIYVPISFRLSRDDMVFLINDSGAKILVTEKAFLDVIGSIRSKIPTLEKIISFDCDTDGSPAYEELIDKYPQENPREAPSGDDILGIVYTTGTTARPKGVIRKHRETTNMQRIMLRSYRWRHGDRIIIGSPMFHVGLLHAYHSGLQGGATFFIPNKVDPGEMLTIIEKEKITSAYIIPTVLNMMLQHPDFSNRDLSSMRAFGYVGSPMPQKVGEDAVKLIGPVFFQTYGLTEGCGFTVHFPEDFKEERAFASCGRPPQGVELRIADDSDKDLPVGETGEILFRSEAMSGGYWNNLKLTESTYRGGWLHTGDMGKLDKHGFLYITDRKKDMIISGGENVSPTEIEETLYTHQAVLEASVIGVPDDKWGEAIKAVIVLKQGISVSGEEIILYCRERMAGFKCPKTVDFVAELPKSPVGKILRRELRKKYWEKEARNV